MFVRAWNARALSVPRTALWVSGASLSVPQDRADAVVRAGAGRSDDVRRRDDLVLDRGERRLVRALLLQAAPQPPPLHLDPPIGILVLAARVEAQGDRAV